MKTLRSLVLPTLVLCLAPVLAPVTVYARMQNAPQPPKLQGFKAEFVTSLDEVQAKLFELAESTPADAYGWRPDNGVRSISEVYMHIAGSNYFLATFIGTDAPKVGDLEKKFTKKADVLVELRKSFDHLRAAASRTNDLEKPVKMFGTSTTHRGVLVTALNHVHEHLGQSIAYARMNGVVPPWSR